MTERRQAYRREPIEVDLGGEVISVGPITWLQRNDFGNEVMRQHTQILNEAVQIYVDESAEEAIPQLEAKFAEKFIDPYRLFELGLDDENYQRLKSMDLYDNQIVEILFAICDVNRLDQLRPLLDPNSLTPTKLGGIVSELVSGVQNILKTESSPDSSSQESQAPSSGS